MNDTTPEHISVTYQHAISTPSAHSVGLFKALLSRLTCLFNTSVNRGKSWVEDNLSSQSSWFLTDNLEAGIARRCTVWSCITCYSIWQKARALFFCHKFRCMLQRRGLPVYENEDYVCVRAYRPLIRNKLPHFRHHRPNSGIIQQRPKHADSKNNCFINGVSPNMIT